LNNKTFWIVLIVIFGGLSVAFLFFGGKEDNPSAKIIGQQYDEVGREHLPPDQVSPYNTLPATSGDHGERIPYGEYDRELTDYESLHGLEHGAIAYWYNVNIISDEELERVRSTFEALSADKKYLSPRSNLDDNVKLAMTAWTYLLNQEEIDTEEMTTFFNGHLNKGPELAP
jgi:hypothetical protein